MNAQLSYARNGMLRNSFMRWRRWESPIYRYLFDDLEDTDFRVFFSELVKDSVCLYSLILERVTIAFRLGG